MNGEPDPAYIQARRAVSTSRFHLIEGRCVDMHCRARVGWCWYAACMDLSSLPKEAKELVLAQLEAGHFQSAEDVVCEALRLLREREELFASHREELCAQIAEGVAADERGDFRDGAEAVADVRRRIDERLLRGE